MRVSDIAGGIEGGTSEQVSHTWAVDRSSESMNRRPLKDIFASESVMRRCDVYGKIEQSKTARSSQNC